ncbi:PAS domain-containing protein, partial [Citrobacter koseri]
VSPAWSDILGWSTDELVGRTSEWMEHPDDRTRTREELMDLQQGEPTLRFENRFRGKDGDYHWFSWTAVPEG